MWEFYTGQNRAGVGAKGRYYSVRFLQKPIRDVGWACAAPTQRNPMLLEKTREVRRKVRHRAGCRKYACGDRV